MIKYNHPYLFLLLPILVLVFSFWLMFHTFSITGGGSKLLIAAKAWSDFGSHIPLIRSFSKGANWPPQYPLFPEAKIRYHYLFYCVIGWLERLGVGLDFALNIPSALGITSLVCLIFIFSSRLFKNTIIGILSVIFFFFNSSFSFLDYFSSHPFSWNSLVNIIHNSSFSSFGPWSGSDITAFWNLNIYTNQRHLGLSFAALLLLVYILHFPSKKGYIAGFIMGSLLLLNQAAFLIGVIFYFWYFLNLPKYRRNLIISLFGFIPWFFIANNTLELSPQIRFQPGFLSSQPLNYLGFIKFWVLNLGLNFFLIPLGFLFAPKSAKVLIVPALVLFIIGNIWKFSPDMINNHKFFNFFLIIGSMFTANVLIRMFKIKLLGPILTLTLTLILTLGGLIDLFPVINDRYIEVSDSPSNPDVTYFLSLPPKTVILNSFWFYHPASLAGRSIYNGYSYFTWSYGYDQVTREKLAINIYSALSKEIACSRLKNANINYIEISPNNETFLSVNDQLWKTAFIPSYANFASGMVVYSVSQNCSVI